MLDKPNVGPSLLQEVVDAVVRYLNISPTRIISFENTNKYSSSEVCNRKNSQRIFRNLCDINALGVSDSNLGRSNGGTGASFREALDQMILRLANIIHNKNVLYLELGPEPVKTSLILEGIKSKARSISYLGIDVNEVSKEIMTLELSRTIDSSKIHYLVADYRNVCRKKIKDVIGHDAENYVMLVTSLGSQEGNEHPQVMHEVYRRITHEADYVVTELQILPKFDHYPIFEFTHHPLWRDVSKAFLDSVVGETPSHYGTILVPVNLGSYGTVLCAVTFERLFSKWNNEVDIFLSNYCLKYTIEQLIHIRKRCGFSVVTQLVTGNESVVFQLLSPDLSEKV